MNIVLAMVPLAVAFVMLALLQQSGARAGLATLATAVALALFVPGFHLALAQIALAATQGAATSLTVLYVLFPALLLYQLQRVSGNISVLAHATTRLCPDRQVRVLLLVLGLSPLIESVSGFGVGVVVVIPMLTALGIEAVQACVLGLLGQLAVPWGGLAVGITLGANLTGLNANGLGASTALVLAPVTVGFALAALAMSGGTAGLRHLWPAALIAGLVLFAGEWLFSQAPGVELAGVFAAIPTTVLLAIWGHAAARRTRQSAITAGKQAAHADTTLPASSEGSVMDDNAPDARRMLQALLPYAVLIVGLLLSRLVPPFQLWLQELGVLTLPSIGLHFQFLYNPGFYLLLGALTALLYLGPKAREFPTVLLRTLQQFTPGAVSIVSFLAASQIMGASGMIAVLGNAAATLGGGYSWIAPWLGALGGWLTGSNAGSNAMFARLQQETSIRAGLPVHWVMGAQNGAASIATMISPARMVLATSTTGIAGQEGQLLRRVGPLVLAAVLLISLVLFGIVLAKLSAF
ncbi:MAG: L-lactate permease [Chloroflexota bacterium]|nr:L-lactate permease [Chloroflexota bacterium]